MSSNENERRRVYELTQGYCFYCGCKLDFDDFEIDHFIAEANGGGNSGNRTPSCHDCNHMKDTRTIGEFRQEIRDSVGTRSTQRIRIIDKYMGIQDKDKEIVFYFEKHGLSPI